MGNNDKIGLGDVSMTRRTVLKAAGAAVAMPLLSTRSWAKGKTIQVLTYTDPQTDYIRQHVVPTFEKDYDCKVLLTPSTTLATVAMLRSQKSNPRFSVAMMDDVGIPLAKQDGLIAPLPDKKIANLNAVFSKFVYQQQHGCAFAISAGAPYFASRLNPPVTSFADLWDPRFKGKLLIPTWKKTQSIFLLIAAAGLATGKPFDQAQYNLEPAWKKLAALKGNVQTAYEESGTAILQMNQGQADVAGPDFSKVIVPYIKRGAEVDLSKPKEGAFAGVNCLTLVNNAPEPELGAAFINRMLDVNVQKGLSEFSFAAPSVRGVQLSKDVLDYVPYPESLLARLHVIDWEKINPQRQAILDRFNQLFGA
ncbi:ABC transporter substrate-binding protein [Paraburkholderia tropica]|uniref:ABC transporter substrate-binding protein n=1 Tax=Paraburkholderia tropica TaxID=92647 RepID=UPI002AB7F288|nr:extracellular solute-binding protein [Paraburkholderia tropica]